MTIEEEFISWIEGIIEDDPIPYEIKSLVFYLNSHFEIGFSGTEKEKVEIVNRFFYEPLEAQFFYCTKLYKQFYEKKDIDFCLIVLEKLLKNLKKNKNFCKFNIYYGKMLAPTKIIEN